MRLASRTPARSKASPAHNVINVIAIHPTRLGGARARTLTLMVEDPESKACGDLLYAAACM